MWKTSAYIDVNAVTSGMADRILDLLESGPMRTSALRKVVGIATRNHFNSYYIAPLLARDLIERTEPDHPRSPQQTYRRAK